MPTVRFSYDDLCGLLGRRLSLEDLEKCLALIKCGVEEVTYRRARSATPSEIAVEVTPDRMDMLSVEGIARALKGFLEIETGLPKYDVQESGIELEVDPSVKNVRPYIFGAVVENVTITDESLKQLMQFQEALHTSWCRDRRKASIGVYDLDRIEPPIRYCALDPEEIKFVPLESKEEMTAKKILEGTPKGRKYGHLIEKYPAYPVLMDSRGAILSMPPIINSEDTKVKPLITRNVFIDVTGLSRDTVSATLNLLVANLAERGARIKSVMVKYPGEGIVSPDLKPREMVLHTDFANEILGLKLAKDDLLKLLGRARMGAEPVGGDAIKVLVPPYRVDVLHEIDLVEDVAIAYGYDKIEPELPSVATIGRELRIERFVRKVRDIMVGLGFQEVLSYVMTNRDVLFRKMRRSEREVVEVENPVTESYVVLRDSILPCLLEFLSKNTHVEYPQKVYEVGEVVMVDRSKETGTRQARRLAAAISDYEISFEALQSVLYSLLDNLGAEYELRRRSHPTFIEGRTAEILVSGKPTGIIGEVHPEVLGNFGLRNPVVGMEISLTKLWKLIAKAG